MGNSKGNGKDSTSADQRSTDAKAPEGAKPAAAPPAELSAAGREQLKAELRQEITEELEEEAEYREAAAAKAAKAAKAAAKAAHEAAAAPIFASIARRLAEGDSMEDKIADLRMIAARIPPKRRPLMLLKYSADLPKTANGANRSQSLQALMQSHPLVSLSLIDGVKSPGEERGKLTYNIRVPGAKPRPITLEHGKPTEVSPADAMTLLTQLQKYVCEWDSPVMDDVTRNSEPFAVTA